MSVLVCSLVFVLARPQIDTSVHISWTLRATRASVAMQQLSELSKLTFTTSPQTANEVLVVSVNDVPLSELMKRIATVASAEWKPEPGGFRLVAANALRSQQARAEAQRQVMELNASLRKQLTKIDNDKRIAAEALKKAAAANKNSEEQNVEDDTMSSDGMGGPDDATILQLVSGIDMKAIVGLETGDRLVFATDPNRSQLPLPANTAEILGPFVAAHDASIARLTPIQGTAADDDPTQPAVSTPEMAQAMKNAMERATTPIGIPAKTLLIITKLAYTNAVSASLSMYDRSGKLVYTGQSVVGMDLTEIAGNVGGKPAAPSSPGGKTPIEYAPESKEFLDAIRSFSSSPLAGVLILSPDLRKRLFQPDLYDPLSYDDTDRLLTLAKKLGKPLVADVPDVAATSFSVADSPSGKDSDTLEQFQSFLKKGDAEVVAPDDGWLVVKPSQPEEARNHRLDRIALRTLLKATEQKGIPSLDDIAAYAQSAESPTNNQGLGMMYAVLFIPGLSSFGLSGSNDWNMLRIWGRLSPVTKSTLLQGGQVSLSALGNEGYALEKLLFGSTAHIEPAQSDPKNQGFPWSAMIGSTPNSLFEEPTEIMPSGVPADGYVDLAASAEPIASPISEGGQMMSILSLLGADELAMFTMFKDDPNFLKTGANMPQFNRLRIGQRITYHLTFHIAPRMVMRQMLHNNVVPKDGQVVSMDNLPDDFKKLVAEKSAAWKKSSGSISFGMPGSFGPLQKP